MVHNTNSKLTQQNGHSLDWTDIQKIISSSSLLLWPSSFRWLTSISATFFDVNARALIFSRDVPRYTWLWIFFSHFLLYTWICRMKKDGGSLSLALGHWADDVTVINTAEIVSIHCFSWYFNLIMSHSYSSWDFKGNDLIDKLAARFITVQNLVATNRNDVWMTR